MIWVFSSSPGLLIPILFHSTTVKLSKWLRWQINVSCVISFLNHRWYRDQYYKTMKQIRTIISLCCHSISWLKQLGLINCLIIGNALDVGKHTSGASCRKLVIFILCAYRLNYTSSLRLHRALLVQRLHNVYMYARLTQTLPSSLI